MTRVVVVGGGIAGLTTALHLKDAGLNVLLLEARGTLGGNISTDRTDGWIIERATNGYVDNASATEHLVDRLGLRGRVRKANERAAKRFLYRSGRLHPLPTNPLRFVGSRVLSPIGRLRVVLEPFFARRARENKDRTVYEFARSHIGHEAATVLVDAMVSGIFAGDIHQLSLASTFPKMALMEAKYRSLVRAMLDRRRDTAGGPAGPAGTLTSFDDGLDVLIAALGEALGDSVRVATPVAAIQRGNPWEVATESGDTIGADAVVLATPAWAASRLLAKTDPSISEILAAIRSAGLAVVALGYDTAAVGGEPDGFGFLVPRNQGLRTLGCLWDSSLFPGRAPTAKVLLRVMIGGAHDADAVGLDDAALLDIARRELGSTMRITAAPVMSRIYRHTRGIAQYTVGHRSRIEAIERRLHSAMKGIWLAGSSYYGVSMNACIAKAGVQAAEISRALS
ncbi:MAG: protoporphyrinogen oxidase [Gemmatimonadales bacterium]